MSAQIHVVTGQNQDGWWAIAWRGRDRGDKREATGFATEAGAAYRAIQFLIEGY